MLSCFKPWQLLWQWWPQWRHWCWTDVSGHAWLAGNSSRNHHNLSYNQASLQLISSNKPSGDGLGLIVGQVSGHPGGMHNVVQVELGHGGVHLQQHRQGLANAWIRKKIKCVVYIFIRLGIAEGLSDAIPDDLQKMRCAKVADQVEHCK